MIVVTGNKVGKIKLGTCKHVQQIIEVRDEIHPKQKLINMFSADDFTQIKLCREH